MPRAFLPVLTVGLGKRLGTPSNARLNEFFALAITVFLLALWHFTYLVSSRADRLSILRIATANALNPCSWHYPILRRSPCRRVRLGGYFGVCQLSSCYMASQ